MNISKINSINREIKRLNILLRTYKLTDEEKAFIRRNIEILQNEISILKGK